MSSLTPVEHDTLDRFSKTLRSLYRLSHEEAAAGFPDAAFNVMKELMPFDFGYWACGRAPIEAVVIHYQHLYRLPAEEMSAAFAKANSHPKMIEAITLSAMNADKALAFCTKEAGLDFFLGSFGVDQFMTLYHLDHNLGLYYVISLYRTGERRFTAPECRLFEQAVPHLLDTRRENQLLHLSGSLPEACVLNPAAALVDKEGVVHAARPAFVDLIRHEFPDWHGPYLPDAMRTPNGESFVGDRIALRFARKKDLYLVLGRIRGVVDQLSQRELEIAQQLSAGASHKDIARDLSLAPATIRNHIANIHNKLGTSKVAQITSLLLRQGLHA